VFRHDDRRIDAGPGRCQGDALGVIARAGGDDAGGLFSIGKRRNPVERAPNLERARPLDVF